MSLRSSTSSLPRLRSPMKWGARAGFILLTSSALLVATSQLFDSASGASTVPTVNLGGATTYAVLGGTTVTNTGSSTISGDVGVSPGSAVTGFPPALITNGTINAANAVALNAQAGLTSAYLDAAGRTPATVISSDLGGQTLVPGVYQDASAIGLTGTVTLNGNTVYLRT